VRKLVLLASIAAAAALAAGAGASPPQQLVVPIHDSFYAPFMSDACGIPVTITIDGVAHVRLERNDSGLVVREHDVSASFTAVFASPTALGGTGRSFTNHSPGVATFDYGSGAAIGSTALITLSGLAGPAAGAGSTVAAGQQKLTGTVFGFSPEGIPLVDFDGPTLVEHGRWPTFDEVLAARCSALGGSLTL
jgi:hypothetical protein